MPQQVRPAIGTLVCPVVDSLRGPAMAQDLGADNPEDETKSPKLSPPTTPLPHPPLPRTLVASTGSSLGQLLLSPSDQHFGP